MTVLAIGEQGRSFKSGDLLYGCYEGPQQNDSFILTHFLVGKKKDVIAAARCACSVLRYSAHCR